MCAQSDARSTDTSITARKNYTRQPEDVIRKGLYEPLFKLLGFEFAKQKSGASSAATARTTCSTTRRQNRNPSPRP